MLTINKNVKDIFLTVFMSVMMIFSLLPGFNRIGNLFIQVSSTVILNIIIHLIFDIILKSKPKNTSYSLVLMIAFWVITAITKQINLHITTDNHSFKWLHLFYYDKPALIFVVVFTSVIYYVMQLIIKKDCTDYIDSYKKFIKITTICSLVYYAIILFYGFYLVREITGERTEPNLIPFEVISSSLSRLDYELLFLLLGNIAIFFPLGIFISSLTHNKIFNILLPIIISVGIEISQYYLGNGHPDIDDVLLNVIGYYIGVFVRIIFDRIIYKASDGKFSSFIFL